MIEEEVKIIDFEWEKIEGKTDKGIITAKIIFKDEISFNKFMKIKKENNYILMNQENYDYMEWDV